MITRFLTAKPVEMSARVPKRSRIYAIGDIHGSVNLADDILQRITQDLADRPPKGRTVLIFLGDYVDRGPSSAKVMARLAGLEIPDVELVCLKGNHEAMMMGFLADPLPHWPQWLGAGGAETLASYGIDIAGKNPQAKAVLNAAGALKEAMPKKVQKWLKKLKLSHREGNYLFVHAGVRPNIPLDRQSDEDLMWIRGEFLNYRKDFGAVVVHGHTPVKTPVLKSNRIGIDTMAYASGVLTCLVLEKDQRSVLQTYSKGLRKL